MLSIKQLSVTYPDGTKALQDINLQLPAGMVGLLGPNGAGKSTLMRTLATLQHADSGQIEFDGIDITAQPHSLRQQLGYLPQHFGVYPHMSCMALLQHMAVLKGIHNKAEQQQQIDSLLQLTNLSAVAKKQVASFSGGMRQRFGIAQALLGNPDLLIVDEPTAGLDPEERNRFHNLLVSLGEEKVIILSTHIVDDVAELCPAMAVLAGGQILLQGNPLDLIQQVGGQIWTKTVSQQEAVELEKVLPVISKRLFAGRTVLHVFADQAPEGFVPTAAGLEDVYFSCLSNHRSAKAAV